MREDFTYVISLIGWETTQYKKGLVTGNICMCMCMCMCICMCMCMCMCKNSTWYKWYQTRYHLMAVDRLYCFINVIHLYTNYKMVYTIYRFLVFAKFCKICPQKSWSSRSGWKLILIFMFPITIGHSIPYYYPPAPIYWYLHASTGLHELTRVPHEIHVWMTRLL